MNPTRDGRAEPLPRRRIRSLAMLAAIAAIWEGVKAIFALPSYQLPHLYEILGDFLQKGAGGERWIWIMAQNAGYTALESLIGFVLGSGAGLALAIGFAWSTRTILKSTASLFQTREAWSAILVACALGLSFYAAVALLERLTMPWRVQLGER